MRIGPFGLPELLIILAIVLLIFGASRLPEIGASLGKGIRSFKRSVSGEEEGSSAAKNGKDNPEENHEAKS